MVGYVRIGLVLCAVLPLAVTGDIQAVEEGVRNVGFVVQGQKIEVDYDLEGNGTYAVSLRLLESAGQDAVVIPRSVSGDVGQRVSPGKGKKVIWDALKDVERLEGSDFFFEVRASRSGGISKWVWIGGAGIAAGTGAAVSLGTGGEDKKGTIVIDVLDPEDGQ